jgi:hypothetical protein
MRVGLLLALLPSAALGGEVEVRVAGEGLSVRAHAAPLADVLDRVSRQTGMKVVYEGPPPRQAVTASLERRTPAEAVMGLLEGLGLNYVVVMDATGTRVETLLIAGASTGPRPASPAAAPTPPPFPPHEPEPPAEEAAEAEPEEQERPQDQPREPGQPAPFPQPVPPPPGLGAPVFPPPGQLNPRPPAPLTFPTPEPSPTPKPPEGAVRRPEQ